LGEGGADGLFNVGQGGGGVFGGGHAGGLLGDGISHGEGRKGAGLGAVAWPPRAFAVSRGGNKRKKKKSATKTRRHEGARPGRRRFLYWRLMGEVFMPLFVHKKRSLSSIEIGWQRGVAVVGEHLVGSQGGVGRGIQRGLRLFSSMPSAVVAIRFGTPSERRPINRHSEAKCCYEVSFVSAA